MDVVFRVDASARIGMGHLCRCLVLADALQRRHLSSTFVLQASSKTVVSKVVDDGFDAVLMPEAQEQQVGRSRWLDQAWQIDARKTVSAIGEQSPRCVVVDQYGLDARWERVVAEESNAVIGVIDGIADRPHSCDLLVDPTYRADAGDRWEALVPSHTRLMVGPQYALLRREFSEVAATLGERDGTIENLLIAFGGGDHRGASEWALKSLYDLTEMGIRISVVAGPSKPGLDELRRKCRDLHGARLHVDTRQMARLMAEADLAIGASGTMMWERMLLRLPALVVAITDHQVDVARPVARRGAIEFLGSLDAVSSEALRCRVEELLRRPEQMRRMSKICGSMMGTTYGGGANAVSGAICEFMG